MRNLFYIPLEPYPERYTSLLSSYKGWFESRLLENDIPYMRVEGTSLNKTIKYGQVLDACGRGFWALEQTKELLKFLNDGHITEEDCIYFEDFWHPGIEALPYAFHLTDIKPKMFALLHAQSVDPHDFTRPMRYWMRDFEKGIAKILDGIFVTSTCLKDMLLDCEVGTPDKIHITGLPYNSRMVRAYFPKEGTFSERKKQVIFSSRWDKEKNPDFFLKVVDKFRLIDPSVKFVITTSQKFLKSNNNRLLEKLRHYLCLYNNLELRENQTKEQYYRNLLESEVQFNCADQDFVSWTLLEALTCGCKPCYPNYLSFPEVLNYSEMWMYEKGNVDSAVEALRRILDIKYLPDTKSFPVFYEPFDLSWLRMIEVMKEGKISKELKLYTR